VICDERAIQGAGIYLLKKRLVHATSTRSGLLSIALEPYLRVCAVCEYVSAKRPRCYTRYIILITASRFLVVTAYLVTINIFSTYRLEVRVINIHTLPPASRILHTGHWVHSEDQLFVARSKRERRYFLSLLFAITRGRGRIFFLPTALASGMNYGQRTQRTLGLVQDTSHYNPVFVL